MKKQKIAIGAFAALITAEILWGICKPIIKLGLETVPVPLYLSLTIIGAALLVLPLALKDWKRISRRDYFLLIIGSIISITIGNVALLMGLQKVPAVNASLIGLFGPLILLILSVEFLKERLSLRTFLGIMVAFAGAAIIIGKPWDASGSSQDMAIGNMLIILNVFCDVTGTLISKSVLKRAGTYQTTFVHLFAGIVPIAIFSLQYLYALAPSHAGRNGYLAVLFNIIIITFANCLFMYGLKRKKAQEVGVFTYASPVATIVAAWFILSEKPTVKIIGGAMLIFLGIYLAQVKQRHRAFAYAFYRGKR